MNDLNLIDLLAAAVSHGASDLHITTDAPPVMRLHGMLVPMGETALGVEACRDLILSMMSETQRARFEKEWELDFALQVEGVGRFRANAHYSRGALEGAFRYIPDRIPPLASLGHSVTVQEVCHRRRGLVLVTGVTGSGKSTTLASMVQYISQNVPGVIVTIEDPIEFVFPSGQSLVKQREVGNDTHSFADALKHVLRQDPDVILVGELRDTETISAAITASETGHLVLGTLHTIDAPKAIDRLVEVFPGDQQPQIVTQLANSLEAIISQRLLPAEDGQGRVLASEVLVANTAVRATIRERRWEQLVGLIEIGGKDGMHTFDDSLSGLYLERRISKEEAVANARDRDRIERLLREPAAKRKGLFA